MEDYKKQSRRWTLTLNNYTEEEKKEVDALVESGHVTYLCYAEEVGEQGTPHLQMYLELDKKKRRLGVVKLPGLGRARAFASKGTLEENKKYCSKDGVLQEYGTPMKTGSKRSIQDVSDAILQGTSIRQIAENNMESYIRYGQGIQRTWNLINNSEQRNWKSFVKVYIGTTGTGKSRKAHEQDGITWTHGGDRWFDGYSGDDVVLFDDFEGVKSGITFRKLLQVTDRYPLTVPIKGGFINWKPRTIIFTTNVEPNQWYPDEDSSPLLRRIDEITRFANLMDHTHRINE